MSKVKAAPAKPVKKKNLEAFRAVHDKSVTVPAKILAGLAALEKAEGREGWEYEGDFIKRAGLSQSDTGAYRDQFSAHVVETNGRNAKRAWFVDPTVADQARRAIS